MARFFLPCARALAVRCLGQHGGWWRTPKHEHAELAGLSAGLMIWKTFAAMVRPIEAATAVLTSALTKDCGARGRAHRISKTCRPRTRSRAWPSPTQFVGMRRPKVDQPARRAAQSLQDQCFGGSPSTHASLRVVQVGMDDANEAEPSCSARRGGLVIAPDVN